MGPWCRLERLSPRKLPVISRSFFQINEPRLASYPGFNPRITSKLELFCSKWPVGFAYDVRFFAVPLKFQPKPKKDEFPGVRLNEDIDARLVRVIIKEGDQTGNYILTLNEALQRARELEQDLVEVQRSADPPVCKIMDYHREKYIKETNYKERTKSKATLKKGSKEIRFSGKTELNDLKIKASMVKQLMERGYRVKCVAVSKAKKTEEREFEDLKGLLYRVTELIEDVAIIESGPLVEKLQTYMVVRHIKFGLPKKGPSKNAVKAAEASLATQVQNNPVLAPKKSPIPEKDLTAESTSEIAENLPGEGDDTHEDRETNKGAWSVCDSGDDFDDVFDFVKDGEVMDSTSGHFIAPGVSLSEASQPSKADSIQPKQPIADYPVFKNPGLHDEASDQGPPCPEMPPSPSVPSYGISSGGGQKATTIIPGSPRVAAVCESNNEGSSMGPSSRSGTPRSSVSGYSIFSGQPGIGAEGNRNSGVGPAEPTSGPGTPSNGCQPDGPMKGPGPVSGYGIFSDPKANGAPQGRPSIAATQGNQSKGPGTRNNSPGSGNGIFRGPCGDPRRPVVGVEGDRNNSGRPIPGHPVSGYGIFSGRKADPHGGRPGVGARGNGDQSGNAGGSKSPPASSYGIFSGQKMNSHGVGDRSRADLRSKDIFGGRPGVSAGLGMPASGCGVLSTQKNDDSSSDRPVGARREKTEASACTVREAPEKK